MKDTARIQNFESLKPKEYNYPICVEVKSGRVLDVPIQGCRCFGTLDRNLGDPGISFRMIEREMD